MADSASLTNSTILAGQLAALATAICWAITSTAFESAAKKIGSLSLNILRLILALIFLTIYSMLFRGIPFPTDASSTQWFWLSASGLVGIVIGDLMLVEAFVRVGSRISMLIYSSVPPLSGILAFLVLGEKMTGMQVAGMLVTLTGILAVIVTTNKGKPGFRLTHPLAGILLAFGGAAGQAGGYIIGKIGLGDGYDAFAATQIRLIAGLAGFAVIITLKRHWPTLITGLRRTDAWAPLATGSFFGPFLGISLSLYAVQRVNPGVASTLMSIVPILLIPYAWFARKERIQVREIFGTLLALTGVALMFVN